MGAPRRGIGMLLGLAGAAPALAAQDFGVTAGVVFSKFAGADADPIDKTRVGFAAGAFAYFRLSDHFGLQPEALYIQKGGKAEGEGATASFKLSDRGVSVSGDCEEDPESEVKGTDFSLVFGAGVDFDRLTLAARYDLGLTKLDASGEGNDIENRAFYLLVAWAFRPPR